METDEIAMQMSYRNPVEDDERNALSADAAAEASA